MIRPTFNGPGRCADMLRVIPSIVGLILAIVFLFVAVLGPAQVLVWLAS